jgi:hypothetical protein
LVTREGVVARAHLGVARAEGDDDVDDADLRLSRRVEELRRLREERVLLVGKSVEDSGLHVHDEERGGSGIEGEGHGRSPA